MPFYDFACRACGEKFELRLSVSELERGGVTCPACGESDAARAYGPVGVVVRGGGEAACPQAKSCPHSCGCH